MLYLFGEGDDVRQEVDFELERVASLGCGAGSDALDGEDAAGHSQLTCLNLQNKNSGCYIKFKQPITTIASNSHGQDDITPLRFPIYYTIMQP